MRVVPVGAGVGRSNRSSRPARSAAASDAARRPWHWARGGRASGRWSLRRAGFDRDAEALALPQPDLRTRDRAVVGPYRRLRVRRTDEVRPPRTGDQTKVGARAGTSAPRPQYRCGAAAPLAARKVRRDRNGRWNVLTNLHSLLEAPQRRAVGPAPVPCADRQAQPTIRLPPGQIRRQPRMRILGGP